MDLPITPNILNVAQIKPISILDIESIVGINISFDPAEIVSKLGKDIDTSIPMEESGSGSSLEDLKDLVDINEVEEGLAEQIQIAKDNFNEMMKPIKDKIAEYKKIVDDTIGEWMDKVQEWITKGKDWVECHVAAIKREVNKFIKKIEDMIEAAQNWILKQINRLKRELAKMLSDINKKWIAKEKEKLRVKEEAAKKKAEEYAKAVAMALNPPLPFIMGSENQDYNGN